MNSLWLFIYWQFAHITTISKSLQIANRG